MATPGHAPATTFQGVPLGRLMPAELLAVACYALRDARACRRRLARDGRP